MRVSKNDNYFKKRFKLIITENVPHLYNYNLNLNSVNNY